jgi:Sec-independent protein secretion pathway component TatC
MIQASAIWAMLAPFFFAISSNLKYLRIHWAVDNVIKLQVNQPIDDIFVRIKLTVAVDQASTTVPALRNVLWVSQ